MRLNLSSQNWWQEIKEAELSDQTMENLRGAVSSYLLELEGHRMAPPMVYQHNLDRIASEVETVVIDGKIVEVFGDPMKKIKGRQDSFRLRFKEATG